MNLETFFLSVTYNFVSIVLSRIDLLLIIIILFRIAENNIKEQPKSILSSKLKVIIIIWYIIFFIYIFETKFINNPWFHAICLKLLGYNEIIYLNYYKTEQLEKSIYYFVNVYSFCILLIISYYGLIRLKLSFLYILTVFFTFDFFHSNHLFGLHHLHYTWQFIFNIPIAFTIIIYVHEIRRQNGLLSQSIDENKFLFILHKSCFKIPFFSNENIFTQSVENDNQQVYLFNQPKHTAYIYAKILIIVFETSNSFYDIQSCFTFLTDENVTLTLLKFTLIIVYYILMLIICLIGFKHNNLRYLNLYKNIKFFIIIYQVVTLNLVPFWYFGRLTFSWHHFVVANFIAISSKEGI